MFTLIRRVPVGVALGAFVLYVLALSHGVTATSLALTAKVAGWDGMPLAGQPLLWLLTLPFRLLPEGWVPLALNLFAAGTAALTLGLLARTVQLLPWDQPWKPEAAKSARLPVLLACAVCGLEFSFWQEATAATGEMLDLLVLAAALWLLLEYRVRRESRWLQAATFAWGLGMAENWLMLVTLPLFVAGVIWLKKMRFFRLKFLGRLAALGGAGFLLYALLPLVNGLDPHSPWSLGQSWLISLRQTKNTVLLLYRQFWQARQLMTLAVLVYYLVPTLSCLVRLRDEGTAKKTGVDRLQVRLYRGLRVVLLLACLWLAFDPASGPRQIVQHQFGISMPLLTFDYLNALGAAFLAGNLLLASQIKVRRRDLFRPGIPWKKLGAPIAATLLAVIVAGLAAKNLPAILRTNFHPLERFGELAVQSLPAGRGVMLADQPQKLAVFQAALARHRNGPDWLAVDTRALPAVAYRARLERRQPAGWLTAANRHELTPAETRRLIEQIARTNRLFYLHPSFGWFFERFYLEPAGAVYEMKLRGQNPLEIPPSPAAAVAANEAFWSNAWQTKLAALVPAPDRRLAGWQKICQRIGFVPRPHDQDQLLADWCSVALDGWGVALQQQHRWAEARLRLEQALQLNTNNLSARISLACNTNLQAGHQLGLAEVPQVAGYLQSFQRLSLVLNSGGPFDEPIFCYLLGCSFQQVGQLLQAVGQFERARALAPGAVAPELALAELYTRLQMPERARPLISHVREQSTNLPANRTLDLDLSLLEAGTWLTQTNSAQAHSILQSVLQQHPDDDLVASRVLGAYFAFGDYTNALRLVETQLARTPDDIPALKNQATILIQSGQPAAAIPVVNHILALTNLPGAFLYRATAKIATRDFAGAETDLRALEKTGFDPASVSFGLAAIAQQRHDTNQAVHYLRLCLTSAPPGTLVWRQASACLQALEPAPAAKSP